MSEEAAAKKHAYSSKAGSAAMAAPVSSNLESDPGYGVAAIMGRWRKVDWLKRGSVCLRGLTLLFSLFAIIIIASNKHGGWKNYYLYEEYRYLLAVSILGFLYTALQTLRHIYELFLGRQILEGLVPAMIDFSGDQVASYLLISSSSSAIPLTNRMRERVSNNFTNASATAISMVFFAFVSSALSSIVSGYKLATQSQNLVLNYGL